MIKEVEIIKEVPIEIVREVEVVKGIDFEMLQKMMTNMATVEVSKNVVGETRTAGDAKVVERREITGEARVTEITGESYIREGDGRMTTESAGRIITGKTEEQDLRVGSDRKDDLTKVEGIGPKIKGLLYDAGIYTFRQLSESSVGTIAAILQKAGKRYQMHNPATWPEQAGMAADGRWEDLKKWQDELDGGR